MKNPLKQFDNRRVLYPEIAVIIVPIYYIYQYTPFLSSPKKRLFKLSKELREAGFDNRANAVLNWMPREKQVDELKKEVEA